MNNQKKFQGFIYNTKCTIWRISYKDVDKRYNIQNYYSDDYNIVSYNNSKKYKGISINDLNRFYGELCTMYYVWKNNLKSDIVGFDQYRRQWKEINFKEINKGKIQVYTYWNMPPNVTTNNTFKSLGCFLYHIAMYTRYYYPEYKDKLDYLLFKYNEIKNHINIFICKWEIFDKLCTYLFGLLEYMFPNNGWKNSEVLYDYIKFNVKFHKDNPDFKCVSYLLNIGDSRHIILELELIFGTIYNMISESFCDGTENKYYVSYNCNSIEDFNNILKKYPNIISKGIDYVLLYCNNLDDNILRQDYGEYIHMYYKKDNENEWIKLSDLCINTWLIECVIQEKNEIHLDIDEYIDTPNSFELYKGNYKIKKYNKL